MKSQEILVGKQSEINISLIIDAIGLDEVVAVGYGTMRRSDLTGSVTKVNIDELSEIPNVSVIQAMQGTVAGLNIGAVDAAGENPSITIRGQNTLSSGAAANAPLIVVDGIIYRGSLVDLNTADIESVDILKDASSAAIYGSEASNGVMFITTKKGDDSGKPIINYSGSYTLQVPSNALKPMKSAEFKEYLPDPYWENGSRIGPDYLEDDPSFSIVDLLKTNEMKEGFLNGTENSMWDILTGNGYINTHNLSVRGKTKSFGYYFSGGITDVKGFMANDEYTKYNYRVNLDAKINDWMSFGMESFLTSSDYSGVAPNQGPAFMMHPWTPIYEENGEPRRDLQGVWFSPLLTIEQDDSDKRLNLWANIHADIKLPVKGLSYRINFSQNYRTTNHDNFNPWGATYTGSGYKNASINYDYTVDNIVSYKNTFNDVHNVNATLVYGVEKRDYSYTNAGAELFTNDLLGYNKLEAGDPTLFSVNTGKEGEQSLYSMARVMYNYNNRYLITGTVRRDGFSGFGTDRKMGVFSSIAFGWVASEENFVKDNITWLNYLKMRGSYGTTGKRGVGRYDTQAIVNAAPVIVFGDGATPTTGQYISSLANNSLGWETTTGANIGADFAVFNSKLHGNIEYYNNNTKDILYAIQLPRLTGFANINTNIGEVANHGIEFSLTGQIMKKGDFVWEASVNFSRNRNKIVSILGDDNDGDGKEDDLINNTLFIGEPTDVIYDYEIIGMWQLADRDAGIIPSGFYPGTYKIADLSGPDGEPDGSYSTTYDQKILGYKDPSYRLGISNNISYKRFSLYVFINTIQGGKDYYYGTDDLPFGKNTSLDNASANVPSGAWDYWMPENPDARFRRQDAYAAYNPDRYIQRNFIRLQDVSLSYNFDKKLLTKFDISNLKVFVSGKNLATITKWRGWDPETGEGFNVTGVPVMSNYTFGVNVEF
jgi:TonB-linked SusC/RagA family outer membrane protein